MPYPFRYAMCNEAFEKRPFAEVLQSAARGGYTVSSWPRSRWRKISSALRADERRELRDIMSSEVWICWSARLLVVPFSCSRDYARPGPAGAELEIRERVDRSLCGSCSGCQRIERHHGFGSPKAALINGRHFIRGGGAQLCFRTRQYRRACRRSRSHDPCRSAAALAKRRDPHDG